MLYVNNTWQAAKPWSDLGSCENLGRKEQWRIRELLSSELLNFKVSEWICLDKKYLSFHPNFSEEWAINFVTVHLYFTATSALTLSCQGQKWSPFAETRRPASALDQRIFLVHLSVWLTPSSWVSMMPPHSLSLTLLLMAFSWVPLTVWVPRALPLYPWG